MNSPDDSEGLRSGEGARVDVDASLTDLRLLLEMKLVNVGYRLGPRLQLLVDSYVVSAHASSSSWLAAQQCAKIFVGAHEAHLAAFYALGDVLLLQALPEAVVFVLLAAQEQLAAEASLETAARALMFANTAPDGLLRTTLHAVQIKLRNHVVWQAQLGIPLGDRDAYMKALTLAFGEQCYNDILESQLMIAHTKEIGDSFPDAFLSNAKLIALRRKHKKTQKTNNHEEAEPEPTAPIPHKPGLLNRKG